jgi:hypothetical protein
MKPLAGLLLVLVSLAVNIAIIYVIVHFIAKFW